MKKNGQNGGLNSLLGSGVECHGKARVEGTLRLDGTFRGTLVVEDALVIGQTGVFEGTACAREIVVAGSFTGELLGTERVELQKGARLEGDVLTRSFVVEPGVHFDGNCRMEFTQEDEARLRDAAAGGAPSSREAESPVVRSLQKG